MTSTITSTSTETWCILEKPKSSTTTVKVVTRVVQRKASTPPQERPPVLKVTPPKALPKASTSSRSAESTKKRKRVTQDKDEVRRLKKSRSSSVESTLTASSRVTPSSSRSSASSSRAPTSPPMTDSIYRSESSRSRSTSVLPPTVSREPISRNCYIHEDGKPGDLLLSSESVLRRLQKSYKPYFKNPDDPNDRYYDDFVVCLQYPNNNAVEDFLMQVPIDPQHYDPIMDLKETLRTIVDHYLTPPLRALLGTPPNELLPSGPRDRPDWLRLLERAHLRADGPAFLAAITAINKLLLDLKYPALPPDIFQDAPPNSIKESVSAWTPTGLPSAVARRIVEETYQRVVGPRIAELRKYESFSSTVYGELLPNFVEDNIIRLGGLGPGKLLVDLGSGVGNVPIQAALQTGCKSFGIEVMEAPADIANEQLDQVKIRARMWGVAMGEVELVRGDMLEDRRVSELMSKADVVLVNNKVFTQSLNEAIRPKFLDLKEGALVISLEPFVPTLNARMTDRNIGDLSTIFDVSRHEYTPNSVSWTDNGGIFYVHRVDREGYARIVEKYEARQSGRSTRSRR